MWPLLLCPCSLVIVTLLPAEPVRLFVCFDRIASFIVNADQRIVQRDRRVREDFVPMVGLAKLLREPFRWLGLAVGLFAAGQTPLALFAKRQNKKLAEGASCGTSRRKVRCSLSHQQKMVPQFELVSRCTIE